MATESSFRLQDMLFVDCSKKAKKKNLNLHNHVLVTAAAQSKIDG